MTEQHRKDAEDTLEKERNKERAAVWLCKKEARQEANKAKQLARLAREAVRKARASATTPKRCSYGMTKRVRPKSKG